MDHKKQATLEASRDEVVQKLIDLNERDQLTNLKWRGLLQQLRPPQPPAGMAL